MVMQTRAVHNEVMLDSLAGLNAQDLQGLSPDAWAGVAAQMLARIDEQNVSTWLSHLEARSC